MRREEREALKELIQEKVLLKRDKAEREAGEKEAKEYWEKEDAKTIVFNCNFCGKNQDEVKKLIAGPDVKICDECIELCNEIIEEKKYTCPYCKEKTSEEIFEPDPKDW